MSVSLVKIVQVVTGFLMILVAGVFWGTWFSLSRTMYELPVETFILVGKTIMGNVARTMSIIMPGSMLGLLILIIDRWKSRSFYTYGLIASLLLFAATLIITLGVEVPIDNQIRTWTASSAPADWQLIRDRWETFHELRTFTSLGSILIFLISILAKRNDVEKRLT